uniref:MADF domain-containing protein n=1 Tax=Cacopsylla melanoneura TaxID=428564 RepID=A0A8D8QPS9_9HEMI
MTRMFFKWLDFHMKAFLDTYRKYDLLWNTKHDDYNQTIAREKAYAAMVVDLNIPGVSVADVKAKIKTVRTRYRSELGKIEASARNGDHPVYEPKLIWFNEADKFLRPVVTSFSGGGKRKYGGSSDFIAISHMPKEEESNELAEMVTNWYGSEENGEEKTEENEWSVVENEWAGPSRKKRLSSVLSGPSRGLTYDPVMGWRDAPQEDEFEVFCKSLAIQLRKMPLHRALVCQEQLQKVMTKERLYQLNHSEEIASENEDEHEETGAEEDNSEHFETVVDIKVENNGRSLENHKHVPSLSLGEDPTYYT